MINEKIKNISKILTVSFLLSFTLIDNCKVFATNYNYSVTPEYIKCFGGNNYNYFNSTKKTLDGGFIIVGGTHSTNIEGIVNNGGRDALIIKYDKNSNRQWIKSLGGKSYDSFNDVVETNDGGFVAVGEISSKDVEGVYNTDEYDAIIVKYDKNGNQQWIKSFGGNDYDWFDCIIQTSDNGFIVTGGIWSTNIPGITNKGEEDVSIVKYDENGNQQWVKSFGGNYADYFNSIIQTDDTGFVVVGNSNSTNLTNINNKGDSDAFIIRYDKNGNQQWLKSFGGNDYDGFDSIIQMDDKGFIVVGGTYSTNISDIINNGSRDAFILRYDENGNQKWIKSFGGNDKDYFNSIMQTDDKGFIVVGHTSSIDIEGVDNKGSHDAFIIKYDEDFAQKWIKSFGGNDKDWFDSVLQINDNSFIAVGGTNSVNIEGINTQGKSDSLIIKYIENKTIIPEQSYANLNLEIVADNSLEMSISTNKISFEGYNGVEDLTNNNLNLTVSSGLYYDLYATLDSEIRGTNDTNAIIDKANLKIKTFDDTEYKSFNKIGEKVNIVANHKNGRDFLHNINLKLLKDSSVKADTYNTNITFEVIQK